MPAITLLRIVVEDVDDNAPTFDKESNVTVPYILGTEVGESPLLTVAAYDEDGPGLNEINYFLVPECSDNRFHINQSSGAISLDARLDAVEDLQLCIVASPNPTLNPSSIIFDPKNVSHLPVTISVRTPKTMAVPSMPPLRNSTITILGDQFETAVMEVNPPPAKQTFRFTKLGVEYTPAAYTRPVDRKFDVAELFAVDEETGDVRASPDLRDRTDGVYTVTLTAKDLTNNDENVYVQKFHRIDSVRQLKYVFELSVDELGKNMDMFQKRLVNALHEDRPDEGIEAAVDGAQDYDNSDARSAACFHVLANNSILGEEQAMDILAKTADGDTQLAKLYHVYKIINIQRCTETAKTSTPGPLTQISSSTLFLVIGVCTATLLLISLLVYICFVVRYKEHLDAKSKAFVVDTMSTPDSDRRAQPQFILGPPTLPIAFY